ncbi:cyclopropane-fatty-acyl-phospholipid synthase [Candidatus Roizmanbacteria bacterium RIFCSPLOWO2_02_FULL_40_13]|nr:MAG: cyclopropane-fatty-acyl-phospholipid synthase [Candidatus Roizmanbacteria bacterium RIFCSPLOWO2_02_FULL_40_13]
MNVKGKAAIERLFAKANVRINGNRDWDVRVSDNRFYDRVFSQGSLGLGESYMDGWWECRRLEQLFYKLLHTDVKAPFNWETIQIIFRSILSNMQTRMGSQEIADTHYNLSSEFYSLFLGPYNQYTSLYYRNTQNYEKAEEARLDLICRKLNLTKKDHVLDIGCGWGGFARYAAEHTGSKVTGISIAKEQITYAKNFTKKLPVTLKVQDYRDIKGKYSKVFSGGMIEHVGYKNYRNYFEIIWNALPDDGIFVLDTLGGHETGTGPEPWIHKYIFPNSMIPSARHITKAIDGLFIIEDWHNFGDDYAKTTFNWSQRFKKNWSTIKKISPRFNKRFYRMWNYYLLSFSGALKARKLYQWQIVFNKKTFPSNYLSVR